ncbi:MAG: class II aldolase/adducin family protein [Eubacteriales bacterium]|nr:class II aldolase/adducin family protein [Eubacteriales bacterium]
MEIKQAKELVIKAGHELVRTGLIARTWGNVSCRIDENRFVITPSGREYHTLTTDDIVEVNIEDLSYSGSIIPSSEKGIHRAVYQLYPKNNFVIHTHQENASAISAARIDSFKPLSDYTELGDEILCAAYALPGSKDLCDNVTAALKCTAGNAVIMKHHGVLCFGESHDDAFKAAYQLETACREFIIEKTEKNISVENEPYPINKEEVLGSLKASEINGHLRFVADPVTVRFSRLGIDLKPMVDDFAQIVGTNMTTVEANTDMILSALKSNTAVFVKGSGAICMGENDSDADAVSMIVRKNCTAYFTATALGNAAYIDPEECKLMHSYYIEKYSLLSENRMKNK